MRPPTSFADQRGADPKRRHRPAPPQNYGDVRLQVCLLLGRQDLSPYEGRRMTADDMAAERERNRAEAEPVGLWHHGVYAERQPDT